MWGGWWGGLWGPGEGVFIFVLLLFGPILKYRKNKSAKGSYELII